ncbi:MAG: serine/threonine-protein kinase [Bradymonadia bacterium]|jgi:serine/threonine protein kinase
MMIGEKLVDRYLILEELGRGGMAVVYRAQDLTLKREVAIKLLHPHLASNPASSRRFLLESQAVAKLHHRNIIEIYDAVQDPKSKSNFLVMELIEGYTLRDFVEEQQLRIPEIGMAIISQLSEALAHAHAHGVIHRDIKPENIMIASSRVVKLMDFGIARLLDEERVTASGSLLGSPAHMPPEIIEGESYTETCDIFSLGTVLYFVCTGALPFQGTTPMAVFKSILDANYIDPRHHNAAVSRELSNIIQRAMQTEPSKRYDSADELRRDLDALLLDANFSEAATLLERYFAAPEQEEAAITVELIALYNSRAREAFSQKQIPLVVDNINRSLHYDAGNAEALELLHRVKRYNRGRRAAVFVLGILSFFLVIVASAYAFWHNSAEQNEGNDADVFSSPLAQIAEASIAYRVVAEQPTMEAPVFNYFSPRSSEFSTKDSAKNEVNGVEDVKPTHDEPQIAQRPARNTRAQGRTTPTRANGVAQREVSATTAGTSKDNEPNPEVPTGEAPQRVSVTQPIFPPESYAIVNGTRYEANSSGDIELKLLPGNYNMLLNCPTRCVQRSQRIVVNFGAEQQKLSLVTLDWANATLQITPPSKLDCYFVSRRLDERGQNISYLVARAPNAIRGFNAFGKEIQLEVYAIPKTTSIRNFDVSELERAKYRSTRVSLSPGESRVLRFD